MKNLFLIVVICCSLSLNAQSDSVLGDFNGDGKKEYLWSEIISSDTTPTCIIHCSDPHISPITTLGECHGGFLIFEGDLNGDGTDEVSFLQHGDASEWQYCSVFTYQDNQWREPVNGFSVYSGKTEELVRPDPERKGYVLLEKNVMAEIGAIRIIVSEKFE